MQIAGINLWDRRINPFLGLYKLQLGIAYCIKILLEGFLISLGKLVTQRSSIFNQQIQRTLASRKSCSSIFITCYKQHVENLLGLIHRGDSPAFTIEGLSLRTTRAANATIGRHHQGRMPGEGIDCLCIGLIKRDRILIRAMTANGCARQILISIGMAMNLSCNGMRQPGINRDITAQGFEHIENFSQLKIFFATSGKPAPILPSRILLERKTNTIRMVDTYKSFWGVVSIWFTQRKGFKPRQSQSNSGTLKICPTTH